MEGIKRGTIRIPVEIAKEIGGYDISGKALDSLRSDLAYFGEFTMGRIQRMLKDVPRDSNDSVLAETHDNGVNGTSVEFVLGGPRRKYTKKHWYPMPAGELMAVVSDIISKDPRAKEQGMVFVEAYKNPLRPKDAKGKEVWTDLVAWPEYDVNGRIGCLHARLYRNGVEVKEPL